MQLKLLSHSLSLGSTGPSVPRVPQHVPCLCQLPPLSLLGDAAGSATSVPAGRCASWITPETHLGCLLNRAKFVTFLFLKLFSLQLHEHLLCVQTQPENVGSTASPSPARSPPGRRLCSCCPAELGCQKMKDEFCLLLLPSLGGWPRIAASSCFPAFFTCSVLF